MSKDDSKFLFTYEKVLKDQVLRKLSAKSSGSKSHVDLYGLKDEQTEIYKILENTVKYHEGKSVLIVGPRGVGKTTLVNNCLLDLDRKYGGAFLVIHLSGLFERDDKAAIREIARQFDWIMGAKSIKSRLSERYDDFEDGKRGDYEVIDENLQAQGNEQGAGFEKVSANATMNTIMSLLDRSKLEDGGDPAYNEDDEKAGVLSEQIPIIFVIDEIDKYAGDSKQTLLYNLFDMAQSSSTPASDESQNGQKMNPKAAGSALTVIGVTTKATMREQLEKRVRSRFSQRVLQINKLRTLTEFSKCVYTMLKIEKQPGEPELEKCIDEYNKRIENLVFQNGNAVRKAIVENFYTIKDLNALKNSLAVVVRYGLFDRKNEFFDPENGGLELYNNRNLAVLDSLSELELKLLISCARVKAKSSSDRINFNVAWEEYIKVASSRMKTLNTHLETMGVSFGSNGGEGSFMRSRELMLSCWEMLARAGAIGEPMRQINGINASSYTGGEFNRVYACDLELNEIMKHFKEDRFGEATDYSWVESWCRI